MAQQKSDSLSRPTVGLVLSGGGAKGFAHIGVLKVIEEGQYHRRTLCHWLFAYDDAADC